jgi:teichuronic acid biosynthesis glycosyltransferase TuaC
MRVLFVRSSNHGIDPISTRQGESLSKLGIEVDYFNIIGRRLWGYLRNVTKLRSYIKNTKPDIIHAHYSLSGFISKMTLTGVPVGVSLMGSDINDAHFILGRTIRIFCKYLWNFTIVKSNELKNKLNVSQSFLIPNGVNIGDFIQYDKKSSLDNLGWDDNKIHIIFGADPKRIEKNYSLAEKAVTIFKKNFMNTEIHFLMNIDIYKMPYYYNAANLLLLTSLTEGSPNVIKEAMACNCPIVTTDVGDVAWVLGNVDGCYIADFDPGDIASKIKMAYEFSLNRTHTKGRERIIELGLDSEIIAKKILDIYKQILI